jgi:hypothetical protein
VNRRELHGEHNSLLNTIERKGHSIGIVVFPWKKCYTGRIPITKYTSYITGFRFSISTVNNTQQKRRENPLLQRTPSVLLPPCDILCRFHLLLNSLRVGIVNFYYYVFTEQVGQAITLLKFIRKVLVSKLSRDTSYYDRILPRFSLVSSGKCRDIIPN